MCIRINNIEGVVSVNLKKDYFILASQSKKPVEVSEKVKQSEFLIREVPCENSGLFANMFESLVSLVLKSSDKLDKYVGNGKTTEKLFFNTKNCEVEKLSLDDMKGGVFFNSENLLFATSGIKVLKEEMLNFGSGLKFQSLQTSESGDACIISREKELLHRIELDGVKEVKFKLRNLVAFSSSLSFDVEPDEDKFANDWMITLSGKGFYYERGISEDVELTEVIKYEGIRKKSLLPDFMEDLRPDIQIVQSSFYQNPCVVKAVQSCSHDEV